MTLLGHHHETQRVPSEMQCNCVQCSTYYIQYSTLPKVLLQCDGVTNKVMFYNEN